MRLLTSTLITALTLLTLSCKDNVRIVDPGSDHPSGKVVLGIDNAPAEISLISARLSRSGFHDLTLFLTISDSGRSARGTFENVAVGTWHLRVDAYDDSNVVRGIRAKQISMCFPVTQHASISNYCQPQGPSRST